MAFVILRYLGGAALGGLIRFVFYGIALVSGIPVMYYTKFGLVGMCIYAKSAQYLCFFLVVVVGKGGGGMGPCTIFILLTS